MRERRRKPIALHRGSAPRPVGTIGAVEYGCVYGTLPMFGCRVRYNGQILERALDGATGTWAGMVDRGTEFQSRARETEPISGVFSSTCIRPCKPVENAFIELFNVPLRDKYLNVRQFT